MQTSNIWHKLNLHRNKIILFLLGTVFSFQASAQIYEKENLPNYDEQLIHYGFYLGGHTANLKVRYNEAYLSNQFDSLHSVVPESAPGFTVGFIFNLRIAQYLDFRTTPGVGLYQYTLNYNTYDQAEEITFQGKKEAFYAELPILLKYKSQRRNNFRAYMIGGVKPSFEVSGKRPSEINEDVLLINTFNLALEIGFGIDIYYELFKFSPEIRFSRGLTNALFDRQNSYSSPINELVTNSVSIYFQFQ
ncbi:Outer membrane protein beta-barrel domain-containing protein [Marivirga sericea]|uniref:Outer membrane protein beta-barrel domain-containing protein n=1 Tax=Marivirga sericea TaxID=1028 RepID=A0A1X7LIX4_9BACT|nr:porin family protein [Marivirga sericea]SMG53212.1 Outer membrane protein beta-barrel domain-containing protein [Marivirga sericea]